MYINSFYNVIVHELTLMCLVSTFIVKKMDSNDLIKRNLYYKHNYYHYLTNLSYLIPDAWCKNSPKPLKTL